MQIKEKIKDFKLLLSSVPPLTLTLLVVTVFSMNLLANKSISLPISWLALDCGMVVSWIAFLLLDVLTKHFGPKAATKISFFAVFLNLCLCGVFFLISIIPGNWSQANGTSFGQEINWALNKTFGGSWYVIFGSAVGFLVASVVNNFTNHIVGKGFKKNPNGTLAFLCRSYVSTLFGQFADNFVFSFLVSRVFFGWSLLQCVTCSLVGMGVELLCEALFSVAGYKISEKWRKNGVGNAYLNRKG